jgi:hypothetical protein
MLLPGLASEPQYSYLCLLCRRDYICATPNLNYFLKWCFLTRLTSNHEPLISASHVAMITSIYHHAQLSPRVFNCCSLSIFSILEPLSQLFGRSFHLEYKTQSFVWMRLLYVIIPSEYTVKKGVATEISYTPSSGVWRHIWLLLGTVFSRR